MRTTVLMLIVCMGCVGSASAANWKITEIPVPDTHTGDFLENWTIDDYGHLYWLHGSEDGFTLYRYDWATDSISTIAQGTNYLNLGSTQAANSNYSSGINVAWTQDDGIGEHDIFFYDGDEVTQVTNTFGIDEQLISVFGDSVYYYYQIIVTDPYDYSYRLFHAVKWESVLALDCNTVRSFGYKLDSDLSGDCYVNFKDFAVFAQEWLECNEPNDPNCTHPWE